MMSDKDVTDTITNLLRPADGDRIMTRKYECSICEGTGRKPETDGQEYCRYCGGSGEDRSLPLKKGSDGFDWDKIQKDKRSK
jgi:DnaJ-class molecular chaperone